MEYLSFQDTSSGSSGYYLQSVVVQITAPNSRVGAPDITGNHIHFIWRKKVNSKKTNYVEQNTENIMDVFNT